MAAELRGRGWDAATSLISAYWCTRIVSVGPCKRAQHAASTAVASLDRRLFLQGRPCDVGENGVLLRRYGEKPYNSGRSEMRPSSQLIIIHAILTTFGPHCRHRAGSAPQAT